MEKRERLYDGKVRQPYATDAPDLVIHYFKDDATAFDAKDVVNNQVSEVFRRVIS